MKVLSAIQPSFFPWPGYFDMIEQSDVFIYYDHVQFDKNGWRNRNYFLINKIEKLISLPVFYQNLEKKIKDTKISNPSKSLEKIYKSLYFNYKKEKSFNNIDKLILKNIVDIRFDNLSIFNIFFTDKICDYLNIKTPRYKSSDFENIKDKNLNLINLCKKFECNIYLSGLSAQNYLNIELFEKNKIKIIWHDYQKIYKEKINFEYKRNLSMLHHILMNDFIL
jgi:hypothetical protein